MHQTALRAAGDRQDDMLPKIAEIKNRRQHREAARFDNESPSMSDKTHAACVVGTGIIGSWTALHLAEAGVETTLLDGNDQERPHAHNGQRCGWHLTMGRVGRDRFQATGDHTEGA